MAERRQMFARGYRPPSTKEGVSEDFITPEDFSTPEASRTPSQTPQITPEDLRSPEQLGYPQAMPPTFNPGNAQLIPLSVFESFVPKIWQSQVMRNSRYIQHPKLGPSLMYEGPAVEGPPVHQAPWARRDERLTPTSVPSTNLGSGSTEAGLGGLLPFRSAVRGALRSL